MKNFVKIGAEFILSAIVLPLLIWIVVSIFSLQAKTDRVISIEEKVEYIYRFLLEKDRK